MFEKFCQKLQSGDRFVTIEVTPPHGASMDGIIKKIEESKVTEMIDGFSVTDNPLAKIKDVFNIECY